MTRALRAGQAAEAGLPAPDPEWAYFFDIDGTLAEIADTPAAARVTPALRACIAALATASGGALAFVSGRTIADVDALFPGTTMPAAGQHGAERRLANGAVVRAPVTSDRMNVLAARMADLVRGHPGLVLEHKGSSLALHYRRAPRLAAFAHRTVRALAAEFSPAFSMQPGKRVVELVVAGHDKGRAVLAFLGELPFRGRRPVFVGDDLSDEAAFAVVNGMGGHTIKVGAGVTVARWRLRGVGEVRDWLLSRTADADAVAVSARRRGAP